jgi:hypothetical protein
METKLVHLSDVPIQKGLPADLKNPLRPEWFAGRHTAHLTKDAGLTQFGINVVTLEPGARSSLRHWHEQEDEFVYVLSGRLMLIDENGEHEMREGIVRGISGRRSECAPSCEPIRQGGSFLGSRYAKSWQRDGALSR